MLINPKFIHIALDINECSVQKGGCDQRCANTEGSFFCHCHLGNGLSSDNATKCDSMCVTYIYRADQNHYFLFH